MATSPHTAKPADKVVRVAGALAALAGIVVASIIIAFGPMLVDATGLVGGAHGPAWDESVFTIAIFGAMLLAAVVGGAATGVRPFRMGERPVPFFVAGLGIGVAGIMSAALFSWIANGISRAPTVASAGAVILLGIATVLLQVVAEEIYFRGWLQPLLARVVGLPVAIPVVAMSFAALHVVGGARDGISLINLVLGGLVFGLLAARENGIAPAIGMHLAWNATEQLVLGLDPNPGRGSFGSVFDLDLVGQALWGGTTEGLNGSLGMTFALLAILAPLIVYFRRPA